MPMFADGPATDPEFTRHDGVLEWLAHPEEGGRRASHAIRGDDGVWIVDPLDAPGLDEEIEALGDVAGVAVLANYHARDAGEIAARHDVPVSLPEQFDRVAERVESADTDDPPRIERFDATLGGSGFDVTHAKPVPGWRETILEHDDLLYTPDLLGTAPTYTVGDERLGLYLLRRPFPPRSLFADADPDRVFVGHGRAITGDATAALDDALAGARKRFPRALVEQAPAQLGALLSAL